MNTTTEPLPETATLNKLLAHKDTRVGSRLYHRGAYYVVTGENGTGVGKHWTLKIDQNQDHVPPPQ
jgi:hypothetical protein